MQPQTAIILAAGSTAVLIVYLISTIRFNRLLKSIRDSLSSASNSLTNIETGINTLIAPPDDSNEISTIIGRNGTSIENS